MATPRPDNLETLRIALELLRRIPRTRKTTASELCSELQDAGLKRDVRTIQRLLDMLSTHYDIERDDSSKPYGYRWREKAAALVVPQLNPSESLLLNLAEEHLCQLLPHRLMRSMDSLFTQAQRNLAPDRNAMLERQWRDKVCVVPTSQPLLLPTIKPEVLEAVSEALYENRWLQLDYSNANGKNTQTEVMPFGLAQQGPRLYLVCRFLNYENERSLALHRISKAEALLKTFERPTGFDLKKYAEDGRFSFGEGQRVKLSFDVTLKAGKHLIETPLSLDQQVVTLDDGRLRITATVVESSLLKRWLLGFGSDIFNIKKSKDHDEK
jgi:predicted DNA-binding transcriptional regulator YafY